LIGLVTGILHWVSPYNKFILQVFFAFVSTANLYLIFQLAKRHIPENLNPNLALFAPIFVAFNYLFFERGTTVNTDTILVFGFLGYYYFNKSYPLKLVFLCISIWSKSVLGFLPMLLETVLNYKKLANPKEILKLLILVFASSSWYIYAYFRGGNLFIKSHFLEQIFARASSTLETHAGQWWFYFEYFALTSSGSIFMVVLVLFLLKKSPLRLQVPTIELLKKYEIIVFGVVFLFILSVAKSKLEWYLLPVIYFLSPLVAILGTRLNPKFVNYLVLIFGVLSLLVVSLTPLFSRNSSENTQLDSIATCIQKTNYKKVIFEQTPTTIQDKNKLDSANGSTSTTYRYGGNAGFIYYLRDKIVAFDYGQKFGAEPDVVFVLERRSTTDFIKEIGCNSTDFRAVVR
jgi:hypothetical protein